MTNGYKQIFNSYEYEEKIHEYHRLVNWVPLLWFCLIISVISIYFLPIEISGTFIFFTIMGQIGIVVQRYFYKKHYKITE